MTRTQSMNRLDPSQSLSQVQRHYQQQALAPTLPPVDGLGSLDMDDVLDGPREHFFHLNIPYISVYPGILSVRYIIGCE